MKKKKMMMIRDRRRVREEMGRRSSAPEVRCSKHPKHKQSPGVCSVCLRDKLSRLSTSNATASSTSFCSSSSSSSSSAYSSAYSSSSSYSSPVHHNNYHHHSKKNLVTMFSMPISRNLKGTDNGVMIMMRSRSMASSSINNNARSKQDESSRMKKKKLGFWTKLIIGLAGKRRKEVLVHSNSMREES